VHGAQEFLQNLALVLCVAAVTTVVFQRLRQPVVLGYILAGLIIGPHLPIPLVVDQETVEALSELGVILLMFSLGLEFSLRKLLRVGPTGGLIAVIEVSVMLWLGYVVARLFGWSTREAIFTGAIVSISSTTIIAKAFDEQRVGGKLRETVFSVLIVEDVIAVILLATLTPLATGAALSAGGMAHTIGRLGIFLVGLVVVGLLVIPRTMRAVVRLDRPETTLVASIGICFAVSLLAQKLGYSVALGAFLAGSLVAESGEVKSVEPLIRPVRDVFAAIFFVAVGMMIEPKLIVHHWLAVLVLVLVVVLGKVTGVSVGSFFAGNSVRTAIQSGMSMAQIGEFSFIIAGLGLSLDATGKFLYPVAVAVSAVTTFAAPWLIRASDPVAKYVDRKLPKPLQTFASLYGSWIDHLRQPSKEVRSAHPLARPIRVVLVDAALLVGIIIVVAAIGRAQVTTFLMAYLHLPAGLTHTVVLAAEAALALPFCIGIVRGVRRIGRLLALRALPAVGDGELDLAAAPRRMLVVALQLAVALAVGGPLVVITQPFLPPFQGVILLGSLLLVLGIGFWRSASNLQGHLRAGAHMIAEALATQSHGADDETTAPLTEVARVLPGIGHPVGHRLAPGSPAVGQTLRELNLRGLTGATVLAIRRHGTEISFPAATERLASDDVLALAGAHDAIASAQALLDGHEPERAPPPGRT
jgi:CPA2 family monovalent cation:H+ antiporter-2